jgi:hypothetical protein
VAVAAFIWLEQTEPERPLTANQQAALRADLLRQGVAPRDADLEVFERSGIDVRALPRVPLEIDYAPPSGSLGAAAAEAQVIMHVRIQKLAFEAGFEGAIYANLRAHVLNVIKDEPGVDAGDALWIRKAGGPERLPETSLVFAYFLGENEADPHVFEETRPSFSSNTASQRAAGSCRPAQANTCCVPGARSAGQEPLRGRR